MRYEHAVVLLFVLFNRQDRWVTHNCIDTRMLNQKLSEAI